MSTETNLYPVRENRANPHPIFRQMREENPVWRGHDPSCNPIWYITRYEDVVKLLKDPRFIRDPRNLPPELAKPYLPDNPDPLVEMLMRNSMLFIDEPEHTRLRSLVHKAFTPRHIRALESRIHEIANDLIEKMLEKRDADLIADFAYPLPITVIAEMIGVEAERRDDFRRWARSFESHPDRSALQALIDYINQLIEARRNEEHDDILNALVHLEEDGDRLPHEELLAMVRLLLVAGHETTVNLIANGMLLLNQYPEQRAELIADRSLMPTAIEEILRYEGPLGMTLVRFASEDIEIHGVTIPQGDVVYPSLMAANRDPEIFDNPETFDIKRDPNPHIAFGFGIHYCLGAPLARLEGTIALNALLDAFPDMQLATSVDSLEWNDSPLFRGLQSLPIKW